MSVSPKNDVNYNFTIDDSEKAFKMMIKTVQFILLFAATTLMFGCASTSKASVEKDASAKSFAAPENAGAVYLYRTGRAVGAAGQLAVKVNGIEAGGTGPGTYFRWELRPGTYTFASSTGESSAVVEVDVKAGQIYFIRQDARLGVANGRVTLKEVDGKKGQKEISGCRLLVSSYTPGN